MSNDTETGLLHGLRRDLEGNVIDLDGTVLEKCEGCGDYCLPDEITSAGTLCDECLSDKKLIAELAVDPEWQELMKQLTPSGPTGEQR
ncbi:hypothetical protein H3H32_10930 [Spirosoma foliorum]|uniref:Uncharacterized protein n=1 Tax=Spirosoma foliorum TaxID=2710596 RepID=A0A7G5H2L5_9BACT|nr:hypothetical protein H3H32_10930 [Spirosoma foliorum]